MVPESIREFFAASAGVAGTLIGLLFVAISVAAGRLDRTKTSGRLNRISAAAALTGFTNALSVSMFALVPGHKIGPAALAVGVAGLGFVAAALISLYRLGEMRRALVRDVLLLAGLGAVFVWQVITGAQVLLQPDNPGAVNTIAILVIVCFLIGVGRSWELIGAPSFGITREVTALVRDKNQAPDERPGGTEGDRLGGA